MKLKSMKILLVDDSKAARMFIKSMLTEYDDTAEFIEAEDGAEAVELFKKEEPDFAFLDLTMPVMNGFDAMEEIKKDFPDPIIIVLTADIQTGSVAKCMEYGAYTVIKKLPKKDVVFKLLDDIYEEIGVK